MRDSGLDADGDGVIERECRPTRSDKLGAGIGVGGETGIKRLVATTVPSSSTRSRGSRIEFETALGQGFKSQGNHWSTLK